MASPSLGLLYLLYISILIPCFSPPCFLLLHTTVSFSHALHLLTANHSTAPPLTSNWLMDTWLHLIATFLQSPWAKHLSSKPSNTPQLPITFLPPISNYPFTKSWLPPWPHTPIPPIPYLNTHHFLYTSDQILLNLAAYPPQTTIPSTDLCTPYQPLHAVTIVSPTNCSVPSTIALGTPSHTSPHQQLTHSHPCLDPEIHSTHYLWQLFYTISAVPTPHWQIIPSHTQLQLSLSPRQLPPPITLKISSHPCGIHNPFPPACSIPHATPTVPLPHNTPPYHTPWAAV